MRPKLQQNLAPYRYKLNTSRLANNIYIYIYIYILKLEGEKTFFRHFTVHS